MMTLIAWMIGLGLLVALHAVVIPRAEASLRADREATVIGKAARLCVLYLGRSVATMIVLIAGLALAATLSLRAVPEDDPDAMAQLIERLHPVRRLLLDIPSLPFLLLASLSFIGLASVALEVTRRRTKQVFESSLRSTLEKLAADKASGRWVELEPTPEMKRIDLALADTLRVLDRVENLDLPPAARAEQVEKLEQRSVELMDQREKLDVKRRITLTVDLDQLLLPPARNFLEKLLPLWMRPGPLREIGRERRILLDVGLALIALGITGALLRPVGMSLDRRLIALDGAMIDAAEARALAKLGPSGLEVEDGDQQEAVAVRLSRVFEEAFGSYLATPPSVEHQRAAHRERLLVSFAAGERGRVDALTMMQEATFADQSTEAGVAWLETRGETREPITSLGARFHADGALLARKYPGILAQIGRAAQVDGPLAPPGPAMLAPLLASETVGTAMGQPPKTKLPMVRDIAAELADAIGKEALERLYQLKARQFNTTIMESGSLAGAAHRVATDPLDVMDDSGYAPLLPALSRLPRVDAASGIAATAPPALRAPQSRDVDLFRAHGVLTALRDRLGFTADPTHAWRLSAALAEYDDHSPAQRGAELTTPRGKLLTEWGAVLPDPGLFARSRNVTRMSESARTAGLVIGLPPLTGKTPPPLTGIEWDHAPDGLHLRLIGPGQTIELGVFEPSLVRWALAYAADGRPLALGIGPAHPLPGRRVVMHPAFVDTPLGCRLTSLTERLDTYARAPEMDADLDRALQQIATYAIAWSVRVRQLDQVAGFDGSAKHPAWARSEAELRLVDPTLDSQLRAALADPARLAENDRSLLHARPGHFDPLLVEVAEECAASGDRPRFEECVTQGSRRWQGEGAQHLPWPWWHLPPEASVGLALSEAPFMLDADLAALRAPNEQDPDALVSLFRFGANVVLVSPANKAGGGEDGTFGRATWPIASAGEKLAKAVRRSIEDNLPRRRQVAELGQVIVLQRLFRLALSGGLGPDLPIERLHALANETARARPAIRRTVRWMDTPGSVERSLAVTLRASLVALDRASANGGAPGWLTSAQSAFGGCLAEIERNAKASTPLHELADEAWSARCTFSAPDAVARAPWAVSAALVQAVSRQADATRELRRLRNALGVHRDDDRGSDPQACGRL